MVTHHFPDVPDRPLKYRRAWHGSGFRVSEDEASGDDRGRSPRGAGGFATRAAEFAERRLAEARRREATAGADGWSRRSTAGSGVGSGWVGRRFGHFWF